MGVVVKRFNYLCDDLGIATLADRFNRAESSCEPIWGVKCLRTEDLKIERILRRITTWWHGVGARPRLAATLSELKRGFDNKGAKSSYGELAGAMKHKILLPLPRRHRMNAPGRYVIRGAASSVFVKG